MDCRKRACELRVLNTRKACFGSAKSKGSAFEAICQSLECKLENLHCEYVDFGILKAELPVWKSQFGKRLLTIGVPSARLLSQSGSSKARGEGVANQLPDFRSSHDGRLRSPCRNVVAYDRV